MNALRSSFCATALLLAAIISTPAATEYNLLPNGSFEFWSQSAPEVLNRTLANGPDFGSPDPLLPVRWEWQMRKPSTLSRSENAHGGRYAVRFTSPEKGPNGTLQLHSLEVVPGATYGFGVWVRGRGRVTVQIPGQAAEGTQMQAEAEGWAKNAWTKVGGRFTVPGHIRIVALQIELGNDSDLLIDDAYISAALDHPYDADAVLRDKMVNDADTLLYCDFDKDFPGLQLNGKAHITADHEGRFGRALRLDSPDQAVIPLNLPKMPEEGTFEFWISPDALPMIVKETWQTVYHLVGLRSATFDLGTFTAATDGTLSWIWRIDGQVYGKKQYLPTRQTISLARMRKGQWTHVAVEWDPRAWRIYVDGVLADWKTTGPMSWWAAPVNVTVSSDIDHYCWSGLVDEIRVSKVKRYGPVVPSGVTFPPLPEPADSAPAAEPVQTPEKPKVDLTAERAKLIGSLEPAAPGLYETKPNARGHYVYEATSARALVKGFDPIVETNRYAPGLVTAQIDSTRKRIGLTDNAGVYWKLGAIRPGNYWISVVYRSSGRTPGEAPVVRGNTVYRNGRIVQCDRLSEPVQVAPGVWFAEMQAAAPEALKPGDEIAMLPTYDELVVARLILRAEEPPLGAFRWPINFGGHWWEAYTALGVNAEVQFLLADGRSAPWHDHWWGMEQLAATPDAVRVADGRARARCIVSNPLSIPVTVDYVCEIKGFYRQIAGHDAERLELAPHSRIVREIPFELTPDDPGYSAEARVTVVNPPALPWPEGDTIAYFPGYRQSVQWPDPFAYRDVRRLAFTEPVEDLHRQLNLNGMWRLAYTPELDPAMPPPANLTWKDVEVPKSWHQDPLERTTPRPHGGYFTRTFVLPESFAASGTVRLVVRDVKAEATAWVNGQRVGNVRGEETPIFADISRVVRPGTNELVLLVRDLVAIMNPAYVNKSNPQGAPSYLDAPGLHGGYGLHVGNVWLETAPIVSADDILVLPSVRRQTLTARLGVVNHRPESVRARVTATVMDARKPVFELGEQVVEIAPHATASLEFQKPWSQARLWSPDDPHLFVLAVEISDAATGERLDFARARFGFRESWIDGPNLYFNGIPVKLKGLTTPYASGTRDDFQLGRHTLWPDYCDEFGYMRTEGITGVYNTPSRHNVERDVFWETARSNLLLRMKLSQNRPSVIAWELSNEWLAFLSFSSSDPLRGARRLKGLADAAETRDPSRWTYFDADNDLHGLHNNQSMHYMLPFYGDYAMHGHSVYLPDGFYWRELDKDFVPGEPVVASSNNTNTFYRVDQKVLMDTENLWKTGQYMPPGLTRYVGDEDVLSPAIDSGAGAIAWYWKQNLDGHRDLGTSSIKIYGMITGAGRRGYQTQAFLVPDVAHHAFSGQTRAWKYVLFNDIFAPAKLTFSWTLVGPDGRVASQGREVAQLDSAEMKRGEFSLRMPAVKERTVYTLRLRLESDGKFINSEERDLDIWPDQPIPAGALAREILLYEPSTEPKTAQVLRRAGIKFQRLETLDVSTSNPWKTLVIIGENALSANNAADVAKLDGFVTAGGRVLILAQPVTPEGLPAATKLEPREWVSQAFVRQADHPVLSGVTTWDLHFWAPDRVTSRGAYTKPDGGPAATLVDSGAKTGQDWVELMEMYRGKGLILLCQMPLVEKYDVEPMTRELLARFLRYLGGTDAFLTPIKRLHAVVAHGSALERRLSQIGAMYSVAKPDAPLAPNAVALVDATIPVTDQQREAWANAVKKGAALIVFGARPEDADWLGRLAGRPASVTVPPYMMWDGRGYRTGADPLMAGLSLVDLYWKRYEGHESALSQAEEPKYMIEPLQDWSAKIDGARELIFPGALSVLEVGQGRLIIDQRRWWTGNEKLVRMAMRNAASLLLGAGVEISPVVRPRALPKSVDYRPIDLSAFANRGFIDEVAEDGKGGWTDQGPKGDLRGFPTGQQRFQGIPFKIGEEPKCCIVLSSQNRPFPERLPAEVTIPIGYPVEGLWFLHGAAFSRDDLGLYQIQYADGITADIPLYAEVNLHDWSAQPGPFLREKGTQSSVAWTGSCPMFPTIGIYKMLWVNPRPDVPVKAVRFSNPTRYAVPVLIGLTAVTAKGADAKAPEAQAKAQALFARAMQAVEKKNDAEAFKFLQEALKADSSLTAAHQALADICERRGDENAALTVYRAWANAGAITPHPYNRIMEILEQRKDYKGALEAATKSLEIEWNQPPTITTKARLETLLNQ